MSRLGKMGPPLSELPIAQARFDEILDDLYAGRRIDDKTRADIAQLLEFLFIVIDRNRPRRGATPDLEQWERATAVLILMKRHDCNVDEAIHAVLPNGTLRDGESLKRTVRRVASRKGVFGERSIQVRPKFLAEAEGRLAGHK